MFHHQVKVISIAVIVAVLVLGVAPAVRAAVALAPKEAAAMSGEAASAALEITNGRLTGTFNKRPLFEILDRLGGQAGFEYRGSGEVLREPVSGQFEGVAVIDALRRILDRFNYLIVFKAKGEIDRLRIFNVRTRMAATAPGMAAAVPGTAALSPESSDPDLDFGDEPVTLAEADLTLEEILMFEVADLELGPPPDLLDDFEPWTDTLSAETGPQADQ